MLVDPPAEDWLMWRRTYGHWGHSPLDQINTTNVGGLRLAWAWTMREGRQETTPLVLFIATHDAHLVASPPPALPGFNDSMSPSDSRRRPTPAAGWA